MKRRHRDLFTWRSFLICGGESFEAFLDFYVHTTPNLKQQIFLYSRLPLITAFNAFSYCIRWILKPLGFSVYARDIAMLPLCRVACKKISVHVLHSKITFKGVSSKLSKLCNVFMKHKLLHKVSLMKKVLRYVACKTNLIKELRNFPLDEQQLY